MEHSLSEAFFSANMKFLCNKTFFYLSRFEMAHERSKVIVVLKGELPPKEKMPETLQKYIQTNTYLSWKDPWFWKKLRYALPHKGVRAKCCQSCFVRKNNSLQMKRTHYISGTSYDSRNDLVPMDYNGPWNGSHILTNSNEVELDKI